MKTNIYIEKKHTFVKSIIKMRELVLKDSFWYYIWQSLKKTKGIIMLPLSLIPFFIPELNIWFKIGITIVWILIVLIIVLFDAGLNCYRKNQDFKVCVVGVSSSTDTILLARCGNLLSIGVHVKIYQVNDNFESFLENGEIINIQANLLTQIKVESNRYCELYKTNKDKLLIRVYHV